MLHVLLEIEECVEEYRRHFASLQVGERYAIALYRFNHVEHLRMGNRSVGKITAPEPKNRALSYLTQTVFERKRLDSQLLHSVLLLLVEIFKFVH